MSVIEGENKSLWIRRWVLGIGLMATSVLSVGCEGCSGLLEGPEARLQEDRTRSGKVGVLRGLEIAEEARSIAGSRARQKEERCQIGWDLENPFEVSFVFEIRRRGERERWWREEGSWRRDGGQRWTIESVVEFEDGPARSGVKERRVVAMEEGFLEFVDEQRAARSPRGSAGERWWRDEYGGRFQRMTELAEGTDANERGAAICDPNVEMGVEEGWMELWREGVESLDKRLETFAGDEGQRCRELQMEATIDGGSLEVVLQECHRSYEGAVEWGEVELVEVPLDESRVRIQHALEAWENEGWIEETDDLEESSGGE